MRRLFFLALLLTSGVLFAADHFEAVAWYDTLGFPDAKNLPYVRVATGASIKRGDAPWQNRFVEGFLLRDEPKAFTVFLCSVSPSFQLGDRSLEPEEYPALTTVRFVRRTEGAAPQRVDFEALDFEKVAPEALARVRAEMTKEPPDIVLLRGQPLSHRARIFAFGRACLQKGLSETGTTLIDLAAALPDTQTGKAQNLRQALQTDMGAAVLWKAEADCGKGAPWTEMLPVYESFERRFPASPRVGYAREAAEVLRQTIAAEAAHVSRPIEQLPPAEQVAESIYQLQNLRDITWIMNSRYPVSALPVRGNGESITPVHRLVDLGDAAVPKLIEALDDRRFTHSLVDSFHMQDEPKVMRVADVAQKILEHLSGRNFFARRADDGKLLNGPTREQAEAWWRSMQGLGEKQALIQTTAAGGDAGHDAARQLIKKYPEAALDAMEAGIRATKDESGRGEFVRLSGGLPGDLPLAFLQAKLAPGNGVPTRVAAAEALFKRGQPAAVPAIIEAWQDLQPRLRESESAAYRDAEGLVVFLATSNDARAIAALWASAQQSPVEVRMAVVHVFLPVDNSTGIGASGPAIFVPAVATNVSGDAELALQRLLAAALADTERRIGREGNRGDYHYKDARVCDVAAHILACRWPEKFQFTAGADAVECDRQIAALRRSLP